MSKETQNTKKMVKRGKVNFHVTHGGGHSTRSSVLEKRASCSTGGFYKSPTAGQTVNTTSDLTIEWDTSCMSASLVDIYLYAPTLSNPRIYEWPNVTADGSFSAALDPKWWGSAASVNLQLAIVEANQPAFLATMPAGPIFSVSYDPSASTGQHSGPSGGVVAAAVLVPIIVIALLVAGAFVKIQRARGREDRRRYSEAVDRRMSTISKDWQSITPSGASAAIRASMAAPGARASSFSFGAVRPQSSADGSISGGQAGIGARAFNPEDPQMAYARPGVGLRPGAQAAMRERSSRAISFADQVRPSEDSRRSRIQSRAFHVGAVPPLPTRQDSSGEVSPVQREGAFTLSAEDIRSRLSTMSHGTSQPSMDDYMPALSMMRNGGAGASTNDLLIPGTPDMPAPPTPTHVQTPNTLERSPVHGLMPMQAMPAAVMSPDELLRQYAERRQTGTASPISPGTPVSAGDGRTPLIRQSEAPSALSRYSVQHGHDDDEDPYGGHA